MDGWGINPNPEVNAIERANTSFVDSLYGNYPNSELKTHAQNVGLPEGQMGNSEVGHMNLGAGRIVFQELLKINNAISSGDFFQERILLETFEYARTHGKKIHFIGLVSDGGVHSHINHLKALIDMTDQEKVVESFVHIFTDGRDCDPHSGKGFVEEVVQHCTDKPCKVASVIGRYYAMDRDKRWERIKLAYNLLINGKGAVFEHASTAIQQSYDEGISDEFIQPIVITKNGQAIATLGQGDIVICFNFRTDRCRQITYALTQEDLVQHDMSTLDLHFVTMTRYDEKFKDIKVVYDKEILKDTLGDIVSRHGLTQLRIAETEKYPHVTFFFSGGREELYEGERRIMINSPKVATYDLQPEMSAYEVTEAIVDDIRTKGPDFICLNFANTDMVGHTGVFEAAMKAAETVDHCVQQVVQAMLENNYTVFLTADHGNADMMINADGSANTAHTKNLVPLFVISNDYKNELRNGKLADLAPSILKVMGLPVPELMTGEVLINTKSN